MPVLLGPLFSLSASGLMGKALLFYDTKYGARVRKPKSKFVPPNSIWEVNIEWFKKASIRSRTLTFCQKEAWKRYSSSLCDTWRDIFMGAQIEAWNLHPTNDISWPNIPVEDIGSVQYDTKYETEDNVIGYVKTIDNIKLNKWCCCFLWAIVLDDPRQAVEEDITNSNQVDSHLFDLVVGHTSYLWGGVRYLNGSYTLNFIDSFER